MTAHDTIFAVTLSLILAMGSTADAQRVPPSGIVDDKIEPAVKRHVAKTLTFRHQIHQNPELGNREYETAKLVESHLRALGIEVRSGIAHRRCCTALAESEIRLWWWPRYVSSMKYPKRCQYKHAKQKKYHVRNWAEYNEGLRRRGDLTVWFDEEAIANWKADKTGKPGGQRVYSDMAIETGLVVRMVYKLAYRQTEGFLHSITSLLGLGIEIPDYSTLCRRSRLLRKKLRIPKAASTQPIH